MDITFCKNDKWISPYSRDLLRQLGGNNPFIYLEVLVYWPLSSVVVASFTFFTSSLDFVSCLLCYSSPGWRLVTFDPSCLLLLLLVFYILRTVLILIPYCSFITICNYSSMVHSFHKAHFETHFEFMQWQFGNFPFICFLRFQILLIFPYY